MTPTLQAKLQTNLNIIVRLKSVAVNQEKLLQKVQNLYRLTLSLKKLNSRLKPNRIDPFFELQVFRYSKPNIFSIKKVPINITLKLHQNKRNVFNVIKLLIVYKA